MKSFTLVEALVVFSLFILILGSIFYTLTLGRQTQDISFEKLYLLNKLASISLLISKELRKTNYSHITDLNGNSLVSDTLYKGIRFSLPQIDNQGNKIWSSDYIEYDLNTTRFLRRTPDGQNSLLENVSFSSESGFIYRGVENKLEVIINCTKSLPLGRELTQEVRWAVFLRNR